MEFRKILIAAAVIGMLSLSACGPKTIYLESKLDTPQHHVTNGMKLLKFGKIDAALSEFTRAKELDPAYSPAYVGLGLVDAFRGDFVSGIKSMDAAREYAREKEQETAVAVGYMRLYLLGGEKVQKDWLKQVENEFNQAKTTASDLSEPYFYLGLAYKMSYDFPKAAGQFAKVLELKKNLVNEAKKEYGIIQKIEKAMPGTAIGKKVSLVEKVTRAEAAALFMEELRIDELFQKKSLKKTGTLKQGPDRKPVSDTSAQAPPATDIYDHALKSDIDGVIAFGIKGLQPFPDHTFKPYAPINRAELAMMFEDILVKITGADELTSRYSGKVSPFTDVRNDQPFFNAVMLCTTRGIMTLKDPSTKEFDPTGPVSGVEFLLNIRAMKNQL